MTAYKVQQLCLLPTDIWGHWPQLALQIQGWAESGSSFPVLHPASSRLPQTKHVLPAPSFFPMALLHALSKPSRLNTGRKSAQCDRHVRPLQGGSVLAPTWLGGLHLGLCLEYQWLMAEH